MRRLAIVCAWAMGLSLAALQTSCVLSGKPKAAAAAPPAPQPAPPPAPKPAPVEPLSVAQTQVQLPPPQPLTQEALESTKTEAPAPAPAAPRVTRRTTPAQPKPEAAAPPVSAAPATSPPPEPVAPVQEVLSEEARRHLQDSIETRKADIQQALSQFHGHKSNPNVKRIQSLMEQSANAARRGELRQADALAERAQLLARELVDGK